MTESNTEKRGLQIRLEEAVVRVDSRVGELKGLLKDPSVSEADQKALQDELLVFEGMIALADHLQNPGRSLSELDAPTLIRLKAERNSMPNDLTGGQRIPRIIARGFPGHMGIRP